MHRICSMLYLLILETLTILSPALHAAEQTVFGFKLENSTKEMTLVKLDAPASYRYRFGSGKQVDLEFPKANISSSEAFELDADTRDQRDQHYTITFQNGGFRYRIYEVFNEFNNPVSVGILVKNMKTREEKDLKGDRKTIMGSLVPLKDDPLIKQFSPPQALDILYKNVCRVSLEIHEDKNIPARIEKREISAENIRSGLIAPLLQKINQDMNRRLDREVAEDKSSFKDSEAIYFSKGCEEVKVHEIQRLIAGKKLDEFRTTDQTSYSVETLGTKIIVISRTDYSESGASLDWGTDNLAFYRLADGKELARKQLFHKKGLEIIDREVRNHFGCKKGQESDPSGNYYDPCIRFKSVLDQGNFWSKRGRVVVDFSGREISFHGTEDVGVFDGSEFDTFLK